MDQTSGLQAHQNTWDELVEALEDATNVLEAEFRDTEGSGHATLLKCKKALSKAALQGR